jgi:tRNA (guanine-N7-)-methyltransferase
MTAVSWRAVFGNDHPVEVEIGPGRGETLLALASASPGVNFFAVERARRTVEDVLAKLRARGLDNVRVVAGDVRCVLAHCVPDASVAAYHVYFPDPWPKRAHRARRLAGPELAGELRRTLVPGGTVHVATDLPDLLEDFRGELAAAGLVHRPGAAPPRRPSTSFERRYATAGTHYAQFARPASGTGAPAPDAED